MPAPLSIIIPTLNAADVLPGAAEALLEGVTGGIVREMVVSDGGSGDGTQTVARELGARLVDGSAGRGAQIRRGVAAARGDWFLILHADTHLSNGWSGVVERHMALRPDKAGFFRLRFRARGFASSIVSGGANLRSRVFGLPYGDQGLLVHRDLLTNVGGVPDIPLMEDVALARRLRGRLHRLDAFAETSAARYERDGWTRRTSRNLWTLLRYLAGTPPDRLIEGYEARSQSSEN